LKEKSLVKRKQERSFSFLKDKNLFSNAKYWLLALLKFSLASKQPKWFVAKILRT
jgi:hypothetical protein